jgi:hypothetical protein
LDKLAVATYSDSHDSSGFIGLNCEYVIGFVEYLDRAGDFDWERAAARGNVNNEYSEKRSCNQGCGR